MATTAADPVFVDTNVLVYSSIQAAPRHVDALMAIGNFRRAGVPLWISRQILREYLATLSRPHSYTTPLPPAVLLVDVIQFQSQFRVAEDGPAVTANLLALMATIAVGGKQVHDANIVATMQARGIRRLLTHNAADFARFAGVIAVVPL